MLAHTPLTIGFTALCATLLSVACAPMTTSFYRPEAPGGRVVLAHCPPVRSFILLEHDGVILGARVSDASADGLSVTITFEVPVGKTVRLLDDVVEVFSPVMDTVTGVLTGSVWASPGRTRDFPLDAPMLGQTTPRLFDQITAYGQTEHAYFIFDASLAVRPSELFSLALPGISVNDSDVTFPPITLRRDSKTYLGSLNC